jgi:hypothetical protein
MKGKDKNIKAELADLYRYSKGKMTDRERHDYERELQKDPFADEAAEGFSGISPDEAESDLSRLERQIKSRVSRKQKLIFLRIAASVAVLMILSSVYIVLQRSRPSDEPVNFSAAKPQLDIVESKSIKEPQAALQKEITAATEKLAETEIKADRKTITPAPVDKSKDDISNIKTIPHAAGNSGVFARAEAKETDFLLAEEKMAAPAAAINKQEPSESEKLMTDYDTLVTDLSEVVSVGYGSEKKASAAAGVASKTESIEAGYSPPLPVNGQKSFDLYIEENIQKPVTLNSGQRVVVVISFLVRSTGAIDSIKVIRNPGKEFSDEAVRLIKNGPSWKPAERNGATVDDEVRVRIVFK